ncbi:MAG: hypothetical protein FWD52_08650 [Candidatus Bathyarchaeota archaeon]|nr:hypothetical protein [Candidatus Termiticorpusculum sp.]
MLKIDATREGTPPFFGDNRKTTDIYYELSSENSVVYVDFRIENDVMAYCCIYPTEGQVITNKQYTNLRDAVTSFLNTYQAYTKIDSNNLITMLNNIDLTKDTTIINENTKLTITTAPWMGLRSGITFKWAQVINGVEYTSLTLTFDKDKCLFLSVEDDRTLYTIGDTSINISQEQAINIAVENLKNYSYEMADGSIVKDFDVSSYGWIAELSTAPFDYVTYELRPYWDIRIFFDEIYPGNVFAVSALIWANTGEIISYGNMATGRSYNIDDVNFSDASSSDNILVFVVVVVVVVALAIGLVIKKKRK